jgi:hypothetical protein
MISVWSWLVQGKLLVIKLIRPDEEDTPKILPAVKTWSEFRR